MRPCAHEPAAFLEAFQLMRAYGYVRVSTAEQASNDDSLDTQKQQITGYAMMKGWEIAQFFVEGGVSGSVPLAERPEGQRPACRRQ